MAVLDGQRLRVDREHRARSVEHVHRPAGKSEPKSPERCKCETVEVDAPRAAAGRVERVHERRPAGAVVEGVGPATIRARRSAERLPAHLLLGVVRVDDRLRIELPRADVVAADGVTRGIDLGEVLDQVNARAVR
jgi:hypothetical protein